VVAATNARPTALILLALGLTLPGSAQALAIRFESIDLADLLPGEDLREYRYQVSEFPFAAGHGFSILFEPDSYGRLDDPPPVNADWDVLVLQPDPQLPDDGLYDALALAPNPSVADPFVVSFVWLGAGDPGPQPFVVYDPSFQVVASGETAVVPEPSGAAMLAAALLTSFAAFHGRRRDRAR
jgi:hypothetical protein